MEKSYILVLLLLVFQDTMFSLYAASPNETDIEALLSFKHLITNNTSFLSKNWTTNTSFCSWFGITCSPQNKRVMSLNLPNMNLEGKISPSIANFSFLTMLNLSNNIFSGNIPTEIGNLSQLVELDLSHNQLSGSIPPSFFSISSLRAVYLVNNSLSGSFLVDEVKGLLNLEVIDLSYNRIIGEIPSRLPLQNHIGGEIPQDLGNLSKLKMLGFDFNNLTGEIPESIFNISSLEYIAFTDNDLSGRIPTSLGLQLPNLKGIFLADNQLEGEIPMYITNAAKLIELELAYNFFTGTVPSNLGNLRQLEFLNLGGNQLTNEPGQRQLGFLNSLVDCRMLQFLILANNPLNGFLPDSISNLSSTIEMFNIENGQING
ncbi:hypothetical protein K7X08_011377 [Anisodus acutangulus]|uniref:Leucine-rich repeat-containing N-terminal plant-type domain-containing protein n=1 Tax=Anisodus acutangulus TaxID=402998 RepID=A0A9Q1RLS8_9SOLA|nr:hypothetical protein K7X08_011377 [Anisodus acutangulus]